ncbi:MAG: sodium:calcium antiporter, partial [Elusimicrobiota bacterium]|nr:sodium:calcium antiporter [Elusimicrobiota bacterium]
MPNTLLWIIIFIVSLFTLIKASDYFTDASEKIGLYFGLPSFIIGVVIVAIGTSLPELISSIVAVLKSSPEIVVGNVIGSNITNILLVLGFAAIIGKEVKITYKNLYIDVLLLLSSALLLSLTILDGIFTFSDALICLLAAGFYVVYTLRIEKEPEIHKTKKLEGKTIAVLFGSSVFIYLGAEYTVESVLNLSEIFNMGKEIIAISAVAL